MKLRNINKRTPRSISQCTPLTLLDKYDIVVVYDVEEICNFAANSKKKKWQRHLHLIFIDERRNISESKLLCIKLNDGNNINFRISTAEQTDPFH